MELRKWQPRGSERWGRRVVGSAGRPRGPCTHTPTAWFHSWPERGRSRALGKRFSRVSAHGDICAKTPWTGAHEQTSSLPASGGRGSRARAPRPGCLVRPPPRRVLLRRKWADGFGASNTSAKEGARVQHVHLGRGTGALGARRCPPLPSLHFPGGRPSPGRWGQSSAFWVVRELSPCALKSSRSARDPDLGTLLFRMFRRPSAGQEASSVMGLRIFLTDRPQL